MTIVTLRPDGTLNNGVGTTVTGGSGTRHGVTSDNSDSSYVTMPTNAGGESLAVRLSLADLTAVLPAGAVVKQFRVRARVALTSTPSGEQGFISVSAVDRSFGPPYQSGYQATLGWSSADSVIYDVYGAWGLSNNAASWYDALEIWCQTYSTNSAVNITAKIYELYFDVEYNVVPTVTVSAPTGTALNSTPTCTWAYSDADGDAQIGAEIKVFSAAQYGAGGFDPSTSSYTYATTVTGAGNTVVLGALASGTYRAYVRVQQANVGSVVMKSTWQYSGFVVNVLPVSKPTWTAYNPRRSGGAPQRMDLVVRATTNLLGADNASLDGALGNWTSGGNCSVSRTTVGGEIFSGIGALKIQASGSGTLGAYCFTTDSSIIAGETYSFRMKAKANSNRNVGFSVDWYSPSSLLLSVNIGTFAVTTNYQAFEGPILVAPPGATKCAIIFGWTAAGSGDICYFDEIGIQPSGVESLFQFFDPSNEMSFETNIGHWVAETNCSLVRTTTAGQFESGVAALKVTATAGGDVVFRNNGTLAVNTFTRYYVQARVKAAATGRSVVFGLRCLDVNFKQVGVDLYVTAGTDTTSGFVTYLSQILTYSDAVVYIQPLVKIVGCSASEAHYFDNVIIYEDSAYATAWGQGGLASFADGAFSPRVEIEYTDDQGATWVPKPHLGHWDWPPNAQRLDPSQRAGFGDWTLKPGVPRRYRARMLADVSGGVLASDWTTSNEYVVDAGVARLIDVYESWSIDLHLVSLTIADVEPQSVDYPLGRAFGVPTSDGRKGHRLSMTVRTENKSEHDLLDTMLAYGRTLLFTSVLGQIYFVKFQEGSSFEQVVAAPIAGETTPVRWLHTVTLEALEVDVPIRVF